MPGIRTFLGTEALPAVKNAFGSGRGKENMVGNTAC